MVLLELLRLEGLEVLALVEGLMDREGTVTFVGILLAVGDRRTVRVEEGLADCRLFWLLARDSRLFLRAFLAKTGSANRTKAKVRVVRAILAFFPYLSADIIHLLSSAIVSGRQAKLFAFDPIRRLCTLAQVSP